MTPFEAVQLAQRSLEFFEIELNSSIYGPILDIPASDW